MKRFGFLFVFLFLSVAFLPLVALSFSPPEDAAKPEKEDSLSLSLPDRFSLTFEEEVQEVSEEGYLLASLAANGVTGETKSEAVKALAISARSQAFSVFYQNYQQNGENVLSLPVEETLFSYLKEDALPWSEEEKENILLWIQETEGLLLIDEDAPVSVTVPLAVAEKLAEDGETAKDILLLFGEGTVTSFS